MYPCFLCLWNRRVDNQRYVRQEWPLWQRLKPGSQRCLTLNSEPNRTLLPFLHIKLEVMKNFVKAMDLEGSGFAFRQEKFAWISMEKHKVGIFDVPQIRELMKDPMFDEALNKAELSAWQSLKSVCYKLPWKPTESGIQEGNWRVTEEFPPIQGTNVSQTALSAVTLELFSKKLRRFERRSEWALSSRNLHYGGALPRPVESKLSCWLLLVLVRESGGCRAQEEVIEKHLIHE